MLLATIAGVGIGAAGAATGSSAAGQAGAGIISGGITIAERSLLRYQREQEAGADRAAVDYLNKTHQSGAGMLAVLERLASDSLFDARQANPYLQSHPMPRERIATLEQLVRASPYFNQKDPPALQARHDLVRAKLVGFTWSPLQVHAALSDQRQQPAGPLRPGDRHLPQRARRRCPEAGRPAHPGSPDDPYFWELEGQILLETGKPKDALGPLRKAVALAPGANLIKVLLGQALVAHRRPRQCRRGDQAAVGGGHQLSRPARRLSCAGPRLRHAGQRTHGAARHRARACSSTATSRMPRSRRSALKRS